MGFVCYNSYLEIDLQLLRENFRSIRAALPESTELIPVLKGDAYGFGAVEVAKVLCAEGGVNTIALAQVGEAAELRSAGIGCELLVIGAIPPVQIPVAVENDLALTVFRPDAVRALDAEAGKQGKKIHVQIKIETGLNRIGVKPGKPLEELLAALKAAGNLEVRGVFTHFSDGEVFGSEEAKTQFARFMAAAEQVRSAGFTDVTRHICNSGASDWFAEAYLDAVRIGRRLYMDSRDHPLPAGAPGAVGEVASWRTSIMNLHTVQAGETVGYDGVFTAEQPTDVATVCVGYGDGLCSDFVRAGSPVLVNGKRARYIGICMDQCLLDVTGIDCAIGDEVTIFGRASDGSFLSAQELAATVGHEGVYFTDLLSKRVERRYIG